MYEIIVYMNIYFTEERMELNRTTSLLLLVQCFELIQTAVSLREERPVLSLSVGTEPSTLGLLINMIANNIISQGDTLTEA